MVPDRASRARDDGLSHLVEQGRLVGSPAFDLQHLQFRDDPAIGGEADEAVVGADDAVAGHDDRKRVAPERLADGARGVRLADGAGDLAIGARGAGRDGARGFVNARVELRRRSPCRAGSRAGFSSRRAGAPGCRRWRVRWRAGEPLRRLSGQWRSSLSRVCAMVFSGSCTPRTPSSAPSDAAAADGGVEEAIGSHGGMAFLVRREPPGHVRECSSPPCRRGIVHVEHIENMTPPSSITSVSETIAVRLRRLPHPDGGQPLHEICPADALGGARRFRALPGPGRRLGRRGGGDLGWRRGAFRRGGRALSAGARRSSGSIPPSSSSSAPARREEALWAAEQGLAAPGAVVICALSGRGKPLDLKATRRLLVVRRTQSLALPAAASARGSQRGMDTLARLARAQRRRAARTWAARFRASNSPATAPAPLARAFTSNGTPMPAASSTETRWLAIFLPRLMTDRLIRSGRAPERSPARGLCQGGQRLPADGR